MQQAAAARDRHIGNTMHFGHTECQRIVAVARTAALHPLLLLLCIAVYTHAKQRVLLAL
jgi:hypothetical protein